MTFRQVFPRITEIPADLPATPTTFARMQAQLCASKAPLVESAPQRGSNVLGCSDNRGGDGGPKTTGNDGEPMGGDGGPDGAVEGATITESVAAAA